MKTLNLLAVKNNCQKAFKQIANIGLLFRKLLKDGFMHVFIGTVLNQAVAMVSSVVIARVVSKAQYAYLGYSDTIYGYLLMFSGMGLSTAVLKVCSGRERSEKDGPYLKFALKRGLTFQVLVSMILVIISTSVVLPFEQAKFYIYLTAAYPTMYFIREVQLSYVRSKQKNKSYALISFLQVVVVSTLSIIFVLLLDAYGVIIARYIATVVVVVIGYKYIKPAFSDKCQILLTKQEKRELLIMAVTLAISNAFSGMMSFNENLLVSNIIANEEISSNFRVASHFPHLVLLITHAVNIYYFPIIAEDANCSNPVKKKVIRIGVFNFMLVGIAVLTGIIISPHLIHFLYGEKYMSAVSIMKPLWGMRGINAGIRMVPMNMLIAIGKYRFNLFMSMIALFFQTVMDWIFINKYGIIGVVYGGIGVYVLTGFMYWIYFVYSTSKRKVNN